MAAVRLRRRKGPERDGKRPEMALLAVARGSDEWPQMAAFCGFPTADQERKKKSRPARVAEGTRFERAVRQFDHRLIRKRRQDETECPKNEPENRPSTAASQKPMLLQMFGMSHDETFMSHRETADAAEIGPRNRKSARKIGERPGIVSPAPGKPAIPARCHDRVREIAEPRVWAPAHFRWYFRVIAGRGWRPGPEAPRLRGSRRSSAAAAPRRSSAGIFRPPPGRPLRPPPPTAQMGHFCLMNEPSFDATNPSSKAHRRGAENAENTTVPVPTNGNGSRFATIPSHLGVPPRVLRASALRTP
jgi:hypothetical protein